MVTARRQLVTLHQILTAVGAHPTAELSKAAAEAHEGLKEGPRNMIVRNVLKDLGK